MKRFPALAILYYGFTVIIGAILVFYFLSFGTTNKTSKLLTKYAEESKHFDMTRLLSVYQNPNVILEQTLDDGTKFSVYEVDATYSKTIDEKNYYLTEKGYMGIITNPGDNWNRKEYQDNDGVYHNNFGLVFNGTNTSGESISYTYRIGYVESETYESDTIKNTIKNRYYSYETCQFYYFMIGDSVFEENNLASISSFSFVNANSEVSSTIDFLSPLTLTSDFFNYMAEFNTTYNNYVITSESDSTISDSTIQAYVDETNLKIVEAGYFKTNYAEVVKYVPLQNVLKIVGYFLAILIIGDFLVGKHRIIHFFAKLFGKKSPSNNVPEYMDTYEVNVTFKANGIVDDSEIKIRYFSESGNELIFNLNKGNNFEDTKRIQNGTYTNPIIESRDYICDDLPSSLTIKGFKFYQEFTFRKK